MGWNMCYPLCNTSSGESLRIGEAQYEAAGDHDVHDDAHVHVPHEHALLCQSSLRFSINADRLSIRISGTTADREEAASERWRLPLLFASMILMKAVRKMTNISNRARIMAQCNRESGRMR